MRDAESTRTHILEAATIEFADYGLAGARVDRIAVRAGTNKALIYHHFGNKQALFDAAFWGHVRTNTETIPLDADDLPGWTVAIAQNYLRDPKLVRLTTWARLEATPTGDIFARRGGIHQSTLDRIATAQAAGVLLDTLEPIDIFCMAIALAGTWAQASNTVAVSATDPENRRRWTALGAVVRSAFCR